MTTETMTIEVSKVEKLIERISSEGFALCLAKKEIENLKAELDKANKRMEWLEGLIERGESFEQWNQD
jgi:hypothetical protein